MSEASETARAELVAAEILQAAFPVWPRLGLTVGYELLRELLALAYLQGRGDEVDENLARSARRGRGAS